MIVYGSRTKQLAKEHITNKCANCGTQNSTGFYLFQKYAHVFWIPFFPTGKTAVSQCDHCKQVIKLKEMPASLKEVYEGLKTQNKTPLWTFSGLAILAVLISIGVVASQQNDARNAKLILAPQPGDIFEIKTENNQYTLYKVDDIKGDTAFLLLNEYETNKSSGLNDLKRKGDAAYSKESYSFSKPELKEMLSKGEIIDIDRK
jgi:hypothetical protein